MAYSKDEVKQITDKVLNMCKADAPLGPVNHRDRRIEWMAGDGSLERA